MANPFFDWSVSALRFVRSTVVRAEAINGVFDLASTGFDGVNAKLNRAMILPADAATKEILLAPGVRALKAVVFDAAGNLAVSNNNTDSTAVDAATATAQALAASASALAASGSATSASGSSGTAVGASNASIAARDLAQKWATQITPEVVTGQGFGAQKYSIDAAASAASAAQTFNGTTATSLTIATGSQTFTTQAGKAWVVGQYINVARTSNPTGARMSGLITAYATATGVLTLAVDSITGTGTFTDWTISIGAPASASSGAKVNVIVSATTVTAANGQALILTNVAATTVTLPAAPADGDEVATICLNGLTTNVIARNGKKIMGLLEDMTIGNTNAPITLKYVLSVGDWRFI